ncbi:MAG: class I SAM-dependent methyltransferase [Alphaproteobacteria bacterium]|nr:class I SAM-dependent methyltransferase [Alphaproteobacteria bacterium]
MMPSRRLAFGLLAAFGLALGGLSPVAAADGQGLTAEEIAARIAAAPGRPAEDAARDAGRKPAEVLAFLGLASGMTVVDVWAAGGWYTEVLAAAVGPDGKVYAQNIPALLQMRNGVNEQALAARLADGRLTNVARIDTDLDRSELAPGSVDLAITALNFHDVYNARGAEAATAFLVSIHRVLKPGGVLGIIDHTGVPGADNEKLHRIDPALVPPVAEAAGFVVEARSEVLANPADDKSLLVFDPSVRGNTDRFVYRLRKPAE